MIDLVDEPSVGWILLCFLTFVVAIPFMRSLGKKNVDWFEPIYPASIYFALLFIIRGVYALSVGTDFLGAPPFDRETVEAINLSLLFLIFSYIVFFLAYYSSIGRRLSLARMGIPTSWSASRIRVGVQVQIVIGIVSVLLLIRFHGGEEFFSKQKQETLTAAGQAYLLLGVSFLGYAALTSATAMYEGVEGKVALIMALTLAVAVGVALGSKGMALSPILSFLVVRHYLKSRISLKQLVLFALVVIIVMPIFNAYRHLSDIRDFSDVFSNVLLSSMSAEGAQSVIGFLFFEFITRFHALDSFVYIVRDTPAVMNYQFGATLSPLLVAWIPRAIWPEKPIVSFGKIFGETYYRDFFFGTDTAPSPSVLGEGYINFHIFGVIIVAFLAGILLRMFYEVCIGQKTRGPGVFIYAALFLYVATFWETNIAGFVAEMSAKVLVLGSIVWLLGRRGRALLKEKGTSVESITAITTEKDAIQ